MGINRDINGMVDIDANQVIRSQAEILPNNEGLAQKVVSVGGTLVPKIYDSIELTYVVAGPGTGEIQTATYKLSGATVAVLTLSYDGSNRLINVVRS